MDRSRAKELAPIIAAYGENKDIQFISKITKSGPWLDMSDHPGVTLDFPEDDYVYRIKPELKEYWQIYGIEGTFQSLQCARARNRSLRSPSAIIHCIEVIE